jgi:lysine 2,3-aminomutase
MLCEKTTSYYTSLIDSGDPSDPLGRMVSFSEEETNVRPGESDDPIGDRLHGRCASGRLIHRYPDRVLLLVTDRCPAHCRFCFRKRLVGNGRSDISDEELDQTIGYIAANPNITEVVLSGGDPLSLSNERLTEIIEALKDNAGIHSIRIHTRYPVYDPERCNGISDVASRTDVFVVHVNHAREITPEFHRAAKTLRASPMLLNQSVLLKGVNDSLHEIEALSRGLFSAGVLPYYLHYPDVAPGIAHFRIPLEEAMRIITSLQGRLPGYLIPRLVLDIPGGRGKVVLSGNPVSRFSDGSYRLKPPFSEEVIVYEEVLSDSG